MTWALVAGGAQCVWEDMARAEAMLGKPDILVGVKDIWMEMRVDHFCTFHADRIKKELATRRKRGLPDPSAIWTNSAVKIPPIPEIEIKYLNLRGGSSGLLGVMVALRNADKVVLCGIPMNPEMRHYHQRKHGKPWREGKLYLAHWQQHLPTLRGRVKSMSGNTKEMLGYPTREWVYGTADQN
jgi:hypothetical protein